MAECFHQLPDGMCMPIKKNKKIANYPPKWNAPLQLHQTAAVAAFGLSTSPSGTCWVPVYQVGWSSGTAALMDLWFFNEIHSVQFGSRCDWACNIELLPVLFLHCTLSNTPNLLAHGGAVLRITKRADAVSLETPHCTAPRNWDS